MPRPVSRRRSEPDDAPTADRYAGRRGRSQDDEPEEERRPRRGRGELPPTRSRRSEPEPEPEERSRRSRRSEPESPAEPTTSEALDDLSDEEYEALLEKYDIPQMKDPNEEADALLAAILEATEEAPRRGRRGRAEEPDEEPRGRRGRSTRDEDDDDKPRGRGRGGRSRSDEDETPRRVARRGFEGYKKTRAETSSFADDFKLTDDEVLVKFLDDEPFATYAEHGLFQQLKQGQRVWTCLAPEEDCAICNTGHEARPVALWNIVVIPEEGAPKIKVLKAGPKLEGLLEKKAALKTGPLSKEYYSLSQTEGKNNGPVEYAVEVIRERDLKEEWQEEPFTDDELAAFDEKKYDATFVKFPTISEIKEIARKIRDND